MKIFSRPNLTLVPRWIGLIIVGAVGVIAVLAGWLVSFIPWLIFRHQAAEELQMACRKRQ